MVASQTIARKSNAEMPVDFDAIVIGAGVSGLYQLYQGCSTLYTTELIG